MPPTQANAAQLYKPELLGPESASRSEALAGTVTSSLLAPVLQKKAVLGGQNSSDCCHMSMVDCPLSPCRNGVSP